MDILIPGVRMEMASSCSLWLSGLTLMMLEGISVYTDMLVFGLLRLNFLFLSFSYYYSRRVMFTLLLIISGVWLATIRMCFRLLWSPLSAVGRAVSIWERLWFCLSFIFSSLTILLSQPNMTLSLLRLMNIGGFFFCYACFLAICSYSCCLINRQAYIYLLYSSLSSLPNDWQVIQLLEGVSSSRRSVIVNLSCLVLLRYLILLSLCSSILVTEGDSSMPKPGSSIILTSLMDIILSLGLALKSSVSSMVVAVAVITACSLISCIKCESCPTEQTFIFLKSSCRLAMRAIAFFTRASWTSLATWVEGLAAFIKIIYPIRKDRVRVVVHFIQRITAFLLERRCCARGLTGSGKSGMSWKVSMEELMVQRRKVGGGPSKKTAPRWVEH